MPSYFTPALTAYIYCLVFALGACMGSFLGCLAGRDAKGIKHP